MRYKGHHTAPIPVSTLAEALLHRMGDAGRVRLMRLWQHWDMVLGPEYAPLVSPLGHSKGTLLLGAEDSMIMQEISLLTPEILERVNAFMDAPFFTKVLCSLSLGRCPLNTPVPARTCQPLAHDALPPLHGKYLAHMRPDSPITRCYARFVQTEAAL